MLPRIRSRAKKAIKLIERSVSSSKHSLKQTNETPGYARSRDKVELPADAGATPAAVPKPPPPSTGASSSASSSSSSFLSSWQPGSSFPRYMRLLGAGALGSLATGAFLYSVSGSAVDDTQKISKGEASSTFFNRITEQIEFKKELSGEPSAITVLVGPQSCGKTRFLRELADHFEADETAPPFLYIDSRLVSVKGPEAISTALCDALSHQNSLLKLFKFPDLVQSVLENVSVALGVNTKVGDVSFNLAKLAELIKKDEGNLNQTIKKLKAVFTTLKSLPRKPVIVIDEANMLMKWKEPGPAEPQLESLLAFLVAMSKQNNLVHVYLATSDYFLANWLAEKGLAEGNFEIEVIGDLTEEEAREFVLGDGGKGSWAGIINSSSEPYPVPPGAEEHWPAIYERCGGNVGMLKRCVHTARRKESWESALDIVVANSLSTIRQGFKPASIPKRDKLPRWTSKQWETVLECITKAPHHAVLRDELEEKLGKGDADSGNEIILSMVKYNLLALRPYSSLARDLPREVYGDGMNEVVTLPSPGDVWAAKQQLLERKSDADTKTKKKK